MISDVLAEAVEKVKRIGRQTATRPTGLRWKRRIGSVMLCCNCWRQC
jgi:hypothetical protein